MTKNAGPYLILASCFYSSVAAAAPTRETPGIPVTETSADRFSIHAAADQTATSPDGETSTQSTNAATPTKSTWDVSAIAYGWLASTHANIRTPQGETVHVSQSFSDALGDLKFAFMGAVEARHDRLVLIGDVIYISLGSSADGHVGPVPVKAHADVRLFSNADLIGYRVVDDGPMYLDVLAGARISGIRINANLDALNRNLGRDFSRTDVGP